MLVIYNLLAIYLFLNSNKYEFYTNNPHTDDNIHQCVVPPRKDNKKDSNHCREAWVVNHHVVC